MCGIFGCILKDGSAAPIIHAALKRLEYRGYDSVGEATLHENTLLIKKGQGKINDVHALHNLDDLPGRMGVGHTRWATHGPPLRSTLIHTSIAVNRLPSSTMGLLKTSQS